MTATALVTGETLSTVLDMLAAVLLPPIVTSFALSLLLDNLPTRTPVPGN